VAPRRDPACIGDPACIRDPASIKTSDLKPPACTGDPACIRSFTVTVLYTQNRPEQSELTFNADDMFTHLLLEQWIMYCINHIIKCIDTRMNTFKSLDLVSDGHGIGMCSRWLSVGRVGRPTSCIHSRLGRPISVLAYLLDQGIVLPVQSSLTRKWHILLLLA